MGCRAFPSLSLLDQLFVRPQCALGGRGGADMYIAQAMLGLPWP